MQSVKHILVVDDDKRLRELLCDYLRSENFEVTTAKNASDARKKLKAFTFDAMVLDVMMPAETGFELASSLKDGAPPILFLTAMAEAKDRITGLEHGARDYLTKPFEPKELVLRLRNILEIKTIDVAINTGSVAFGAWVFNIQTKELLKNNVSEYITTTEAVCLKKLAMHDGDVVSREALLEEMADISANLRNVDVTITRLRKKIEDNTKKPQYIVTVRGQGYRLAGRKI